MIARHVRLKAVYNDVDISADISEYLKSFSVREVMSGEADTADITLEDRAGLWCGDWFPDRGATVTISLETTNWNGDETGEVLPFGRFEIDEIECTEPPREVKIKLVSVPVTGSLRGVEKSRSWESVELQKIIREIADEADMEVFFDAEDDPALERVEQSEETDLSFMQKLCKDHGLALKVTDRKIIVFDIAKYEKQDAIATIQKGGGTVISFSARATVQDVYKACHVKYRNSRQGEYIEATFTAPDKEEGRTLEVNEKVDTQADAERLARKRLREKNTGEITVSLALIGDVRLTAGCTVNLEGFQIFDGKYIIAETTHSVSGGYTTKIDLRRVLDGY